jgi:cytidylate kinase
MTQTTEHMAHGVIDTLAGRSMRLNDLRRRLALLPGAGLAGDKHLHPFIAVSRQAGAGGEQIARQLGARLAWRVFDKELLDYLAEQCRLDARSLELLDETKVSWFDESVLNLIQPRLISQDDYVRRLVRIVVLGLLDGPAVLVGRGTGAVLPRAGGLSVRVVAAVGDRLARIRDAGSLDEKAARRVVTETDTARREFVRRHFHVDPDDPLQYDLIVNTSRVGVEGAAEIVLAAASSRGLLASQQGT